MLADVTGLGYDTSREAALAILERTQVAVIPGTFVVGHSDSAEEAIAEIVETKPDAIIVDLLLQHGTGYDVLEGVAMQSAKLPLSIVLTNFTMAPHPGRAARLGAAYFFDKSSEIARMFRVITELVDDHRRFAKPNCNHA